MEPIEVFDITVPGTENFYLSAGVVVHNSKDQTDAISGAVYDAFCNVKTAAEPTKFVKTEVLEKVTSSLHKVRQMKLNGALNSRDFWK